MSYVTTDDLFQMNCEGGVFNDTSGIIFSIEASEWRGG